MLKLRLPEELLGEEATLEGPGSPPQEVRAVPMEGPLDPVLEEAVESQPQVPPPKPPNEEEEPPQEARPSPQPGPARRGKPLGLLAALGAGALVVLGVALGGGVNANVGGTAGGAAPRPPAPPSTGSGSLWE
ncbi:hypothetical protein [Thermus phage P23-77]|uniref:Uncharacterized protein n=1 Tax=Thermus virus P23-77 TaxID=1714272 RepID=C8CHK4_9VIRU|nr:hypothetical protein P23-77_gp09 [Thermus phage P23-77]ACV05034.1 hypothetical protein [Thermus phage P23-77]